MTTYIKIKRALELTTYSQSAITKIMRNNPGLGKREGRDWDIDRDRFIEYARERNRLKNDCLTS